jgi:hydrogenase maturation protease
VTGPRVLVACVGNALRGDDGFGIAVAAELDGTLPEGADLIETGIGGIGIVHQLMDGGYAAVIIVDAVERSAEPGTLVVLDPRVPAVGTPTFEEWLLQLSDMHLAEPSRILRIAQAAGVLPAQAVVVGCQPDACHDFDETLTARVAAAVPVAASRVRELVAELRDAAGRHGRCTHTMRTGHGGVGG